MGGDQLLLNVKQSVGKGDALPHVIIGEVCQLCHTAHFFFVLCQPSRAQANLQEAGVRGDVGGEEVIGEEVECQKEGGTRGI